MRSKIGFITKRVGINLNQSGTDIVLNWTQYTGTVTVDPTTQSKLGTSAPATQTVKGFVHYVQATSAVKQFVEVETGDAIVDLHQDVVVDGLDDLVFVIDGEEWMQKKISDKLVKYWSAIMHGQKLFRTVLLRKAT